MIEYEQINALARQAFEHWGKGRLAEAAAGYAAAITLVRDNGLPAVADLHAQLAGVLDVQGQLAEAVAQSELALAAEQAQSGASGAGPTVKIARHFLAGPAGAAGPAPARAGGAGTVAGGVARRLAAEPDAGRGAVRRRPDRGRPSGGRAFAGERVIAGQAHATGRAARARGVLVRVGLKPLPDAAPAKAMGGSSAPSPSSPSQRTQNRCTLRLQILADLAAGHAA